MPVFRALAHHTDRAAVFAGAMQWHARLPGFSTDYLVQPFPLGSSGKVTVVDIGGGLGHASQALARHYPSINCIVQDSPAVTMQGQEELPGDLQGRVSFQAHDFFQTQPVQGADVYLLRLVLHDWSDKYSKMIIRALIPALGPKARIVVNDRVVPKQGEAPYLQEREARDYDMYMLAFQNAKERTIDEWTALFTEVDARFRLGGVSQPPGSALAVMEITWTQ
ncbi:MAG: hypothetical protein Q9222_004483 [Ikaeria aurantiellina]